MKLSYRGNQYTTETALLEVRESDIVGKYRGSEWSYKLPRHIPQLHPKFDLKYRGVDYSTCTNHVKPYFTNDNNTATLDSNPITGQLTERHLAHIHIENLRKNLERRIKVAQENGNTNLLEMLNKESQDLLQLS